MTIIPMIINTIHHWITATPTTVPRAIAVSQVLQAIIIQTVMIIVTMTYNDANFPVKGKASPGRLQ